MSKALPQDIFTHRYELENLTKEKALLAILKPAEAYGLPVEEALREQLIAEQRAATPAWSEVALELVIDARLRLSPKVANFGPPTAVDWPAILKRVTCPALLIAADPARGGTITAERIAAFQSYVPQLRAITVAGAGHCVRYEQFDRYMDIVRGFLAGVTATA